MAERYEVWSSVEGAMETDEFYGDEEAADEAIARLADDYNENLPDAVWAIYVLPHFCDPDDEQTECVCVQYLTDHHPVRTSADTHREE